MRLLCTARSSHTGEPCPNHIFRNDLCWAHLAQREIGGSATKDAPQFEPCTARTIEGKHCEKWVWYRNPQARALGLCHVHMVYRAYQQSQVEEQATEPKRKRR